MVIIKKQKGFALIITISIFIFISALLTATILLVNTTTDEVYSNNKELQAREVSIAGLSIAYDHMVTNPEDYTYIVQYIDNLPIKPTDPDDVDSTVEYLDLEKVYFSVEVDVPYVIGETYKADGTLDEVLSVTSKVYIDFRPYIATAEEIANGRDYSTLIATATTDYGLTNNVVEAEVLYINVFGNYTFQRGNFLN